MLIAACIGTIGAAGIGTPAVAASATATQQTGAAPRKAAATAEDRTLVQRLADARARHGGGAHTATTPGRTGGVTPMCDAPSSPDQARCFALRVDTGKSLRPASATPRGLTPADLLSAYNLPADGGAGATVAIVDAYDNPNAAQDLAAYRHQFGLPPLRPGQFTKVNQHGAQRDYPTADEGWAAEISLDIDMVTAVAPAADILLVEADNASTINLGISVNTAVSLGATYVSNSYGSGYATAPGSGENDEQLRIAKTYYDHPGVAIVASSGDSAYGVSFPAAAPHVTAVGGTSLVRDPDRTRGWSESVWNSHGGGPGSGCSAIEPKPSFQKDDGCAHRTVADVSAVADPETGVAVYDTFGPTYGNGWTQYGGTSASAPIIAATYALGGPVLPGGDPVGYPYAHPDHLNDVTSGSNGTCETTYLCTAGPGYDGPTGLGTPNGTAAFTSGRSGTLSGRITEASSRTPIVGAKVSVTGTSAATTTTGTDGTYTMRLAAGSYTVTVRAFDHSDTTATGVTVTPETVSTTDLTLAKIPLVTVRGKITDASGHGWPLSASIVVDDGIPGGPVHTDPATGRYSIRLPEKSSYSFHVSTDYSGYRELDSTVTTGTRKVVHDMGVIASALPELGSPPGYTQASAGPTESFDTGTAPADWSVRTAAGGSWVFADDGHNMTGGDGGYVYIQGNTGGKALDSSLISPEFSVPASQTPFVSFRCNSVFGRSSVDYSSDGGTTWKTAWSDSELSPTRVTVALPTTTKTASLRVRFRRQIDTDDAGPGASWYIDDVRLGHAWVTPLPGGLVIGNVTDATTSKQVDGAEVTFADRPEEKATTAPLADAGDRADGFYWFFSTLKGHHTVTAAKYPYQTASRSARPAPDKVEVADLTLHVGRLATSGPVSATVSSRDSATRSLTLTNSGDLPIRVRLAEMDGVDADGPAWTPAAKLPVPANALVAGAHDGTVYAGLGVGEDNFMPQAAFFGQDPATGAWTSRADAPEAVAASSGAFIGGKFYVNGGYWVAPDYSDIRVEAATHVYDPVTDSWSKATDNPAALAAAGTAVLDGKMYAVGGMTLDDNYHSTVSVFDPKTDKWSTVRPYPESVYSTACGAIRGKLYCAGGFAAGSDGTGDGSGHETRNAYVYDPAADSWSRIADLPADVANAAYGVANGQLLVSGGATDHISQITGQGFAYDPAMNWWTPLPVNPAARNRSVGVVGPHGFQVIGGEDGYAVPTSSVAALPGYATAGPGDVPWLSEDATTITVRPGHHVTVKVHMDARRVTLPQVGTVRADLAIGTDGFSETGYLPVALTVQAPPQRTGARH
ncbi:carboxypeptidase regulatory-like domain-containing protein [Streptomyces sp. NPDC059215]|uniref:Kelch repeat-containing protein n=1 Tax=Streptomyces sp. NPDC059215 TaxID=3346772 RepID=UPI0036B83304